jgi:DeoR family fructose operon transcriptional repressor
MASGSFLKGDTKMLTEQRYQIILDLLKEKKSVTATELKEILDTSESTVRRDITALHKAGKLIKVFGGAVALEDEGTVSAYEPTVEQKSELYVKEKRKIAQYAAELRLQNMQHL